MRKMSHAFFTVLIYGADANQPDDYKKLAEKLNKAESCKKRRYETGLS